MEVEAEKKIVAKFSVNLPKELDLDLQRWADEEGRPRANLAAFLLELAVRQKYPEKYPPRITKASEGTGKTQPTSGNP